MWCLRMWQRAGERQSERGSVPAGTAAVWSVYWLIELQPWTRVLQGFTVLACLSVTLSESHFLHVRAHPHIHAFKYYFTLTYTVMSECRGGTHTQYSSYSLFSSTIASALHLEVTPLSVMLSIPLKAQHKTRPCQSQTATGEIRFPRNLRFSHNPVWTDLRSARQLPLVTFRAKHYARCQVTQIS